MEIVEAEAVEIGTEIATILMPAPAEDCRAAMRAYQETTAAILDETDWQAAGGGRRFVKKSGWRKLAKAYNLSCTTISTEVDRDANGQAIRASAIVRATAPNGQVSDGDGYCSADESRFRGNAGKLENDLRTTATTRAKNRAISDLVGFGEVSAEEIAPRELSPNAKDYEGDMVELHAAALSLAGERASDVLEWIAQDCGGQISASAARGIIALSKAAHSAQAAEQTLDVIETVASDADIAF